MKLTVEKFNELRPVEVWAEPADQSVASGLSVENARGRLIRRIGDVAGRDHIVIEVPRDPGDFATVGMVCDDPMWLDVIARAWVLLELAEAALKRTGYPDAQSSRRMLNPA